MTAHSEIFLNNERAGGRFWVTDPLFGAKGDGVTDDHAAIVAAEAARAAVGGKLIFPSINPAGAAAVYLVGSELTTLGPIAWEGDATSPLKGPVIRAGSSMRSVLSIRSTYGASSGSNFDPPGPLVMGLILDGNLLAVDPMLCIGDYGATYVRVYIINALRCGIRRAGRPLPLVVSAITFGGGAPTDVTITQPDPNTGWGMKLESAPFGAVVKFTTGGGLGVAQFALSMDGGATYSTALQTVYSTCNLVITNDPIMNTYGYPSGLILNFPSHTYPLNGTIAFTVTPQVADTGATAALNTSGRFYDCGASECGTVYASATPFAGYGANYHAVATTGTIATTAGSQIIVGTGTAFLSMLAREGDVLKIGSGATGATGVYYPIAAVLDDTHMAVAVGTEPTSTASGLQFSISVGTGYWEDGATECNTVNLHSFRCVNNSSNMRIGGLHGIHADLAMLGQPAIDVSVMCGSSSERTWSSVFTHCDFESTSIVYIHPSISQPGGYTFVEPARPPSIMGPGRYTIIFQGSIWAVGGPVLNMIQNSVALAPTSLTVTGGAVQIPAPDVGALFGQGHTSWVKLDTSGPTIMTATPTIAPAPDGTIITLVNDSQFPIQFTHDQFSNSRLFIQGQYVTLGRRETMSLISYLGLEWIQLYTPIFADNMAGNRGVGNRAFRTTTNTPFSLWDLDTFNSIIAPGTAAKFDVTAQSRDGLDRADWLNCTASFDDNDNNIAGSGIFTVGEHYNTAGAAAAWTVTLAPISGHIANIMGTGDNANPIYWSIVMQALSPPYSW